MDDTPKKPKRKRGPKTEIAASEALVRVNLMLDSMSLRKLKVMGEGNVSKGARWAVKHAFERWHDEKPKK